jgi:tetratricopeptide (TPR) repeat protein
MKQARLTRTDAVLVLIVLIGMASAVGLTHWIDAHSPATESSLDEEQLYLNASTVDRASLGFKGLAADWYWMRSLQYVGRKFISADEDVQLDNLGQLNLKLLAPLLDAATTLDPQFMEPFQYATVVLPSVDKDAAIRIIKKGIAANPSAWRLYHNLGYIYWQHKDFNAAREAYGQGAAIPGAPRWMEAMEGRMAGEGGSRDTAREIYKRMYEQAADDKVRGMARKRLMQLDSMDQRDALRRLMDAYKANTGRCPASWRDLESILRAFRVKVDSSAAPLDPAGTPYILVQDKCDLDLDSKSEVPSK